jgi:class 3 adenylate cyclase
VGIAGLPASRLAAVWAVCVAAPAAGFVLLIAAPRLDVEWQHNPSHFWLVVAVGVANLIVGLLLGEAASRRADARVYLLSLALLTSAGFLALHALATPGVIVDGQSAGFAVASPVGLLVAGGLLAVSSLELPAGTSLGLVSRRRAVTGSILALLAAWGVVVVAEVPPLDEPLGDSHAVLVGLAVAGFVFYAVAALRYAGLYRRRPALLLLAVITALVLLAQAMFAVAFSRSWHATWWEWHLLMLGAFGLIAVAVRHEWRRGGATVDAVADVYLEQTRASVREVTVLFGDLQGFTSFCERAPADEVFRMLDAYFSVTVPLVARDHGGTVDKLIGDALMVTFNTLGDQPDHAVRGARAALALRNAARALAGEHPDWPRLRLGVNTGAAIVGLLGAREHRSYTVVGDAVNVASRLEGVADPGGVVIGSRTRDILGDAAEVVDLGGVTVKGKGDPVAAFELRALR